MTAGLAGFPEAEVDADLVEWGYGDYEGITTVTIRETVPGWTVWTHPTPGGETPDEVGGRLDRVVALRGADQPAAPWYSGTATRCGSLAARWLGLPVPDGRCSGSTPRPCRSWASSATAR